MKKIIILISCIGVTFSAIDCAIAQIMTKEELISAKKAELNNTRWTIVVKPMSGEGEAELDMISFEDGKFVSGNFEKNGFAPTSFTVRIKEDETIIWETMQIDEAGNRVYWRGDVKDGVMKGVISRKDISGNTFDSSFMNRTDE